ncbi:serine/threonine-protein kinase [Lyngbya sp. CCY1209]|uniref:serine/threonine-protein kinase n=1 Tax=Lyngbya sp. CCY1209 TaxID=2886103 RepID=UPI002D2126AE|nr:serine/threonine-protein kinase [Lyngbya sp. CCY1209]MEB3886742.1 serine/threonine protein kinase [Lyngbya sp. CCY1209]
MTDQLLDGRYQIVEVIESGEFGSTSLAKDTRRPGESLCFVKHLRLFAEDPQLVNLARRRFQQEAQVLERLSQHDQIPQLLAYFEENQEFYLVESYVCGHSLNDEILPGQPLPEERVIAIVKEVLEILGYVHGQGVIHRDIKPGNLIRRDSDGKLMLLDFGAVKEISFSQNNNPPTGRIGTMEYMPVEQFECDPHLNSDIYALGTIAIQALTGLPPYELRKLRENHHGNPGELVWRHLAIVSSEFGDIVDRMVEADYRRRYQSAEAVLADLEKIGQRWLRDRTPANLQKLETYRDEVKRCADHRGDISVVGQQILEELRQNLELTEEEAEAVEDEILNPYRKYRQKGERYERALAAAVQQQYPFSEETRSELDRLQQMLGISDEDVALIESHILPRTWLDGISAWLGIDRRRKRSRLPAKPASGSRPPVYFWFVLAAISLAIAILAFVFYEYQKWRQGQVARERQERLEGEQVRQIGGLLAAENYEECIARAKAVPKSSSQYVEAQDLLRQCQGVVYWKNASATALADHTAAVESVSVSPDGRTVASASRDNTIKLWNLETGEVAETLLGDTSAILAVDFSSDGTELASGTEFWRVLEWNLQTGELYSPLEHAGPIFAVEISPNNKAIATGSADTTVRVWDRKTGQILYNDLAHTDTVYSVAFSPNGRWLASGSADRTVNVVDLEMSQLRYQLRGHEGAVRSVAITPDGKQVVSGSADNTIKLWNLRSGEEVRTLTGHRGEVLAVAVSADGRQIASGSRDRTVKIWDVQTGELLNTLTDATAPVNSLQFAIDGQTLVGGDEDGTVWIWRR